MKTWKCLLVFATLFLYLHQYGIAQGDYYSQYHPFDSTSVFKEKIVLDFGPAVKRVPKDKAYQLSTRYIDSLSLEKIEYLRTLLINNSNLVVVASFYDSFHMMDGHETHGWYSAPEKAKTILSRILRRDIDGHRLEFYHSECTPGGHTHEHLLSTDRRLELLVYEVF